MSYAMKVYYKVQVFYWYALTLTFLNHCQVNRVKYIYVIHIVTALITELQYISGIWFVQIFHFVISEAVPTKISLMICSDHQDIDQLTSGRQWLPMHRTVRPPYLRPCNGKRKQPLLKLQIKIIMYCDTIPVKEKRITIHIVFLSCCFKKRMM